MNELIHRDVQSIRGVLALFDKIVVPVVVIVIVILSLYFRQMSKDAE